MADLRMGVVVSLRGREMTPRVAELIAMAMNPNAPQAETERAAKLAAEYSASNELELYGVDSQGELLGIAGIHYIDDGVMVLRDLAVWPSARRQGVGRMLLDFLREELRPPEVRGNTWPDAVGFYRACGFEVEEDQEGVSSDAEARFSFCWAQP